MIFPARNLHLWGIFNQKFIAQHDARLWVVSDLSSAGDSSEQKTEESDKDKVSWWQHMAILNTLWFWFQ